MCFGKARYHHSDRLKTGSTQTPPSGKTAATPLGVGHTRKPCALKPQQGLDYTNDEGSSPKESAAKVGILDQLAEPTPPSQLIIFWGKSITLLAMPVI